MNLLIIHPRQPRTTGNQISAQRLAANLKRHDWHCRTIEVSDSDSGTIDNALRQAPDAVLLLHAWRSGRPWLASSAAADIPLAVLLTGTDLNHDLHLPERGAGIRRLFRRADAILLKHRQSLTELKQQIELELHPKFRLLPPGISLGKEEYPLRARLGLTPDNLLFLHPAGIRPVKGNLELLHRMKSLLQLRPRLHFASCGPLLDADYGQHFLRELGQLQRAHYLGEIPHRAMADVMTQADLILNNSDSEGLANVLMEAISLGRPILARDIPGNRAVIKPGHDGLLYHSLEDFSHQALRLIDDSQLRQDLNRPDPERFSASREAAKLASILETICP